MRIALVSVFSSVACILMMVIDAQATGTSTSVGSPEPVSSSILVAGGVILLAARFIKRR